MDASELAVEPTISTHDSSVSHDFSLGRHLKSLRVSRQRVRTPEMARLTLARKIAAITLTLWKKDLQRSIGDYGADQSAVGRC
jgi:hypothetical protein